MADTITKAIDALTSAAFIEGGVSIERTEEARERTEQRKRELIEAIAACHPQAVEAQAPAAVAWENFPCYLIDHCEGDVITEEGLQHALAAMLANPQYSATTPALPATEDSSAGDLAEVNSPQEATIEGAANEVGKWLNERPNRPIDLRHVAMLVHYAKTQAEVQAEPVGGQCRWKGEKAWSLCTSEHVRMALKYPRYAAEGYEVRYLYTAPQAQPADALDAETIKKAARYDWLRSGNDYQSDGPMVVLYESEGDRGDRPYWSIASDALDASIDAAMTAAQEGGNAAKEA